MYRLLVVIVLGLFLTGCGGVKEMEDRDYVMAMGIEKDREYRVCVAVAKLSEEGNEETIYEEGGKSIEEAINKINDRTKGDLYLGHNKIMILKEGYEDFEEFTDYFGKNINVSRGTIIVKANNPKKILEAKNNGEKASSYIYDYFENKNKYDLDKLMECYNKNLDINLPRVELENDNIVVG